jgi:hypothetical protein
MPTTTIPSTFGRRAGATWVAATGAALVLVAAGVLVASQWDRLSDAFKLGLLMSGTGFCAWVGHRLRRTLPATGSVIFHLGVLLVPANLAAIAIHLSASLGQHLLAQGVVGAILFSVAAAATGSVVFRWASFGSVPLVAAGIGALTPIPALAVLIAFAAVGEWFPRLRYRDAVVPWATLVGLAPAVIALAQLCTPGDLSSGVMQAIGIHGAAVTWTTSLAAAAVLAWRAETDHSLPLATLAIASAALGGVRAMASSHLSLEDSVLGIASLFVLVETLALAVAADRFWRRPLAALAVVVEVPVWAGSVLLAGFGIIFVAADPAASHSWHINDLAGPLLVAAAGWFIADMRRATPTGASVASQLATGGANPLSNLATALCASAGVLFLVGSPTIGGCVLGGFAVAFVATKRAPRSFGLVAGPIAAALATLVPAAALGIGLTVAAALVVEARRQTGELPTLYATGAVASALTGIWFAGLHGVTGALGGVIVISVIAACVEDVSRDTADICRVLFVIPLAWVNAVPRDVAVVSSAIAAVLAVEAVRLARPVLAGAAGVVAQLAVVTGCVAAGYTLPDAGVALAFVAVVMSGWATIAEGEWQPPLYASGAVACVMSLLLALGDPQALAIALMVLGGLAVAVGFTIRNHVVGNVGGVAIALGIVMQLSIAHVSAVELYLLPVGVHLSVVGEVVRRRRPVPSWLSATPGPVLVGGAALLERINGGGASHAAMAAVVAAFAVAIGGNRRQIGPLLAGTGILAGLALNESLAALAGVPAWGWIGIVGAALIASAVMIERNDTSPVEAGRRLVDVISDNFE